MTDTTYNGYTNYHTWNVALWIANDETIYRHARANKNLGVVVSGQSVGLTSLVSISQVMGFRG